MSAHCSVIFRSSRLQESPVFVNVCTVDPMFNSVCLWRGTLLLYFAFYLHDSSFTMVKAACGGPHITVQSRAVKRIITTKVVL